MNKNPIELKGVAGDLVPARSDSRYDKLLINLTSSLSWTGSPAGVAPECRRY